MAEQQANNTNITAMDPPKGFDMFDGCAFMDDRLVGFDGKDHVFLFYPYCPQEVKDFFLQKGWKLKSLGGEEYWARHPKVVITPKKEGRMEYLTKYKTLKEQLENKYGKFLRESDQDNEDVRVFVSTYGKYNDYDGTYQNSGKWMAPADYDSLQEFFQACHELHNDDPNCELMFQDMENLPSSLYDESGFSEEAFEYAKYVRENPDNAGAAYAYVDLFNTWDEDGFNDRYLGHYDSIEDYCWHYIDECGGIGDAISHPENYFDYEHFGRELKWDMNEEEDDKYLQLSDYDCAVEWITDMYGDVADFFATAPKFAENYFDIEQFARDASFEVFEEDGYVFDGN